MMIDGFRIFRVTTFASLLLALASCGGSGGDSDPPRVGGDDNAEIVSPGSDPIDGNDPLPTAPQQADVDCSIPAQNQWVDDNMRDYYLFYDQVPVVNLDDYDSPEQLIRDLRVQPFDQFSRVTEIEESNALFEEGREVWFGYQWRRDSDGNARIAFVYDDSPMGRAGVSRGDLIVSLNGVAWEDVDGDLFREFAGTAEAPNMTQWVFTRRSDGTDYSIDVAMAEYSINTVLTAQVYQHPDHEGAIGYLAFRSFLETSAAELDTVMDSFRSQGVTDIVLDLRYNGGGRISMARKLTSQIAGPLTDGQQFVQYVFNDKYQENNFDIEFEPEPLNLGLNRLAVLVTESTASASEMVINGLRPYIPVTLFGEQTTVGKPYISYNEDLVPCGKRMSAMEAEHVNADQVSVAGGLLPDCAASDDLASDFGRSEDGDVEGMLLSALNFIVDGTCETPVTVAASRSRAIPGTDAEKQPLDRGGSIAD